MEAQRAEAERLFLTFSWWILHEGWRGVASRVEGEVDRVFGGIGLKREITLTEWEGLFKELRAGVEMAIRGDRAEFYDFTDDLLPPSPLPPTSQSCPLPASVTDPHLLSLLNETRSHLSSPDAHYLLDKSVSVLFQRLVEVMKSELYPDGTDSEDDRRSWEMGGATEKKRLVDCLPVLDRWGKAVWEGIPDNGVESMLALPEFEGFAALVFGDWAPRV